ncbi:MAG: tRNA (N(6)-L-threonylcarbamoyladenosine(37)-C(2))-methylthiotransferase [Candidatus Kariarchaeaceae archaeon]
MVRFKPHANVFWESYGCSANQADSEMMKGLLSEAGFHLTDSKLDADIVVINTCTVKEVTFHRMLHRIRELERDGKLLVVAGCMPKTEQATIEKIAPNASLIGPNAIHEIVQIIMDTLTGIKKVCLQNSNIPKLGYPRIRKNPVIAICSIASGCLGDCSFCQTKLAKGNLFSFSPELIKHEIKQSLLEGCKEIWLTAQDTGCYGRDIDTSLPELLREIVQIPGEFFIRVGMMNPQHVIPILDELIEAYTSHKIFKFLHLPIQSGSNYILERMNRHYQVNEFLDIICAFKKTLPDLTLSTDIIVGFPGESQSDFEQTLQLLNKIKPDIVNISKYGKRAGTDAAQLQMLPTPIVRDRTKELGKHCKRIQLKNMERWKGWEGKVLLDVPGKKGGIIGRNFAYRPILTKGPLGSVKTVKVVQTHQTILIDEISINGSK